MASECFSVQVSSDGLRLRLLDQRILPNKVQYLEYDGCEEVAKAIKEMVVRGAPAIGAAAGHGYALHAQKLVRLHPDMTRDEFLKKMEVAYKVLYESRPTAVNLAWALKRLHAKMMDTTGKSPQGSPVDLVRVLVSEAKQITEQDVEIHRSMAENGANLLPAKCNVLHHCNTGPIATGVAFGTALGCIQFAHGVQHKNIHVFVDETRPRLQGARLTAWELMNLKIPMTLICDNAAAMCMRLKKIDVVFTGADRIAANGDSANKIGTYSAACNASVHDIPFYIVAPTSTIDLDIPTGEHIPIEERSSDEILRPSNESLVAPADVSVFNPAFDVTPAKFITAIVTEMGVIYPPFADGLRAAVEKSRAKYHH